MLAACNLQTAPPIAATPSTVTPTVIAATPALPTSVTPALEPLRATPTQFTPGGLPTLEVTVDRPVTVIPGQPTRDPATAFQVYDVTARDGQTLRITYDLTVGNSPVTLTLQGPAGIIWQEAFNATVTGTQPVSIEQGGAYQILVDVVTPFDGAFSISWE